MRAALPYIALAAVGVAIIAGSYRMGWAAREAAIDRAVIDVLERIRDAELSEGVPADDRDVILEWLRENQ